MLSNPLDDCAFSQAHELDIILVDTAGRHKEESDLLDEMKQIEKVTNPDLALLVIDGTIGRQCSSQASSQDGSSRRHRGDQLDS